jgi:hypothetical protein
VVSGPRIVVVGSGITVSASPGPCSSGGGFATDALAASGACSLGRDDPIRHCGSRGASR